MTGGRGNRHWTHVDCGARIVCGSEALRRGRGDRQRSHRNGATRIVRDRDGILACAGGINLVGRARDRNRTAAVTGNEEALIVVGNGASRVVAEAHGAARYTVDID